MADTGTISARCQPFFRPRSLSRRVGLDLAMEGSRMGIVSHPRLAVDGDRIVVGVQVEQRDRKVEHGKEEVVGRSGDIEVPFKAAERVAVRSSQ
ncbi:exonuclease Kem1 [Pseudozyma hubeiensis SY62]|uniref:Exonuclease Kem1 n=1 Tax=Pseudozyma hubeiensis (strain SY62) TaxID=1305764 RepID=R9PCG9_PSEHS|nr:exonuclease Kem1 [Pseudozyma hubeiensis SY62]GAC99103.1 exonuclease Kem1 [Pseudozyma hubeiensis SY62]